MQTLLITKKEDFEKLKKLKGKETIYIIMQWEPSKCSLQAISLKNFNGTIELYFPQQKNIFFHIKSPDSKKPYYFFVDADQVKFGCNNKQAHWEYQTCNTTFVAKDEQELKKCLKKSFSEMTIHIEKDMAFEEFPIQNKKIHIKGHGHKWLWKNENPAFDFEDTEVVKVDQILWIRYPEDLKKIERFQTETVAVFFLCSITNAALHSISLEKFTGSLYLLGNQRKIRDSVVKSTSNYLGLFSIIHPYANVYISQLTIENVMFIGTQATVVGGFFATTFKGSKYASSSGNIMISECKIKDSKFIIKRFYFFDPIVGFLKENQEIYHCEASNIQFQEFKTERHMIYPYESYIPSFHNDFSQYIGSQEVEDFQRIKKL